MLLSARASSPLRLIETRGGSDAVWVFGTTFGGGFVEGDRVEIDVDLERDARLLLTTQASTKVYRSLEHGCANVLRARVATGALFASIPDPTVCFEGARFEQRVAIDVDAGGSACVVDVLHAGRVARGERWVMERYRNEIEIGPFRDVLVLEPAHGSIAERMARFDVLATVILAGPLLADARARIEAEIAALPVKAWLLESCTTRDGVLLVRFAAPTAEAAQTRLRLLLAEVFTLVGDVFARKP